MRTSLLSFICILLVATACKDNPEVLYFEPEVITSSATPNSVVVKVESLGEQELQYAILDIDDQIVVCQASRVFQNAETKLLLSGLNADKSYELILGNDQIQEKIPFKTPIQPQWVSDFLTIETNGILEDSYFLLNKMSMPSGIFLLNGQGQIVWSRLSDNFIKMVKLTHRGTILTLEDDTGDKYGNGNILLETTFTNDTIACLKYGTAGFDRMAHHDVELLENGHYAFITNVLVDDLIVDGITVLDKTAHKIWEWDMASHVLPIKEGQTFKQPWANSLTRDKEGHYIVSFRNLNQVWKVHSSTGEVLWKLGKDGDIPLQGSDAFVLQHHAQLSNEDDLLLFDNGSHENRPYSRIVSYQLNQGAKTAQLKLNITLPDPYFSPFMGAVEQTYDGYVVSSSMTHNIMKLSGAGELVWSMKLGDRFFRADLLEKEQLVSIKSLILQDN